VIGSTVPTTARGKVASVAINSELALWGPELPTALLSGRHFLSEYVGLIA